MTYTHLGPAINDLEFLSENLIETGLGCTLDGRDEKYTKLESREVQNLILERGFVVVRELDLNEKSCEAFCDWLGGAVRYVGENVGYGYETILHLDGTDEADKVITGRGSIPLHTDGVVVESKVDVVVLYCEKVGTGDVGGETLVCDQKAALKTLDPELKRLLFERGCEYFVVEKGYFTKQPKGWFPVETVRDHGQGPTLNIGLPFEANTPESWRVRIKDLPDHDSEQALHAITQHFNAPHYIYRHRWQRGDLLLIENHYTLHGRDRVLGPRTLLNGQVVFPLA